MEENERVQDHRMIDANRSGSGRLRVIEFHRFHQEDRN